MLYPIFSLIIGTDLITSSNIFKSLKIIIKQISKLLSNLLRLLKFSSHNLLYYSSCWVWHQLVAFMTAVHLITLVMQYLVLLLNLSLVSIRNSSSCYSLFGFSIVLHFIFLYLFYISYSINLLLILLI